MTRLIGDGKLPPGCTIPVDDVARDFGMSRIPVREALKILEGRGLVTHRPHHGDMVTSPTPDELRELYKYWAPFSWFIGAGIGAAVHYAISAKTTPAGTPAPAEALR